MDKPNYYAIIPANVRYDNELKANEKLLYGEISALCNDLGYCWATNEYFAKLYDVSGETVSRWINHLVKKGYLYSEMIYKENSGEILNRLLKINKDIKVDIANFYRKRDIFPIDNFADNVLIKKSIEYPQKNQGSIDENVKENNTRINNNICPSDDEQVQSSFKDNEKQMASDFDLIWTIYPRKEGKNTAYRHYKAWLKGKKYAGKTVKLTNKDMWYAVKKYADLMEKEKTDKQFIKMGSTFFNESIMEYVEEDKDNEI